MKRFNLPSLLVFFLLSSIWTEAQEVVLPLQYNPALKQRLEQQETRNKKRSVSLPFIDDFAYNGPYPNAALWEDKQAYINNTMGFFPINRGVATLDGLDQYGRPYVTSQNASRTSDSLTSVPIDLSTYTSTNSIFLSFFAQPEGLGFAPETKDSLFLYFKNNNNEWLRVWQARGTGLTLFKMYLVPVMDAQFLHANFQFRFVNIASPNINDDDWHIDYVKMDVNRSLTDSISNDIGFTVEPTSLLKPYTEMPYHQFLADQTNHKSDPLFVTIQNLYPSLQNLSVTHEAKELISSSNLHTATNAGVPVQGKTFLVDSFQSYNITYNPPSPNDKVVIEDKYFFNAVNSGDRRLNDTITRTTVFDNYFAYDDGSAEKSYFLLNAFNYPAKTALKFHLNQADTIRGLAAHFGAQVPSAAGKYFSIILYKQLAGNGLNDSVIHQEDLFTVMYDTTYNGYSYYAFQSPVVVDSGWYYMGITQPANFGSDSIYYGLDVNTKANKDYLFYNVSGTWEGSSITDATLMMRPMVGHSFTPSLVSEVEESHPHFTVYPNPCVDHITIQETCKQADLFTLDGRFIQRLAPNEHRLDVSALPEQVYLLIITDKQLHRTAYKLIKN